MILQHEPRVLIIDDHPLFRDALDSALKIAFPQGTRSNHAGTFENAITQLQKQVFDLVLLDLNLSDISGFGGLSQLRSQHADTSIVVISATETPNAYKKAQALGSVGYLPKSLTLDDLSAALVTLLDGGTWFPPETEAGDANDTALRIASLTPAQRKVLTGLSNGLLNKQIAFEMGISIATVKAHLTAIFRKLGVNNRTQALLIYQEAVSLDNEIIS